MTGIELIKEVRRDKNLKDSVVFILTTSDQEKDIKEAYDLNVAGYFTKDNAGESFCQLASIIKNC